MQEKGIDFCEVCGNEIESRTLRCPFCGFERSPGQQKRNTSGFTIVNLEKGLPPVADALERMDNEIASARLCGVRVLFFIHGYGSSGRGGAIQREVRRRLQYLFEKKEINDFLPGEHCDRRSGHYRQLTRRFPVIDTLVRKPNPGITVVVT